MYKIIGALLISYFIIAESYHELPIESQVNQDVSINSTENKTSISYRLPESVKPNSYYLELKVNLDESEEKKFMFFGTVNISLNVLEATKNMTLHSKELRIKNVYLVMVSDIFRKPIAVNYKIIEATETSGETNFFIITEKYSGEFKKGQYILSISYESELKDDRLVGFYRSYYVNDEGKDVWFAATKFEPTYARLAFPCFDEPALKATFKLKITHSNKLKAITNTRSVASSDNKDGTTTTEFEKTPLMSTYLLAVVVSDFKSIQTANNNFTVHARPNAIQHGHLALNKGEEILKLMEDFTNISFPISKMDQVAMPNFISGAMENWGLVTFREERLLYDEEKSSAMDKQIIVQIIAHEFAHQWFGNLVSPKWWKYLWLNEGFATFFSHYITDKLDKTFRSMEQSIVNREDLFLDFDSYSSSDAILDEANNRGEISHKFFPPITYKKGMAVIRLMQHYVTEDIFQKGLQRYLNDFRYKAADSDDLFNSIQKVINEEKLNIQVKAVMDSWLNQAGYPIVTMKRNYKTNSMTLKQERFVKHNNSDVNKINNTWCIPVSYATEKNPDFANTSAQVVFNKTEETFLIDDEENNQWIILNKQQTGIYRVNYDEENWKLIINYLNSPDREKIHPLNRAQLIDDALVFVEKEMLGLQTLLQLIASLKYETDYIPWISAGRALDYLKKRLLHSEYYPFFQEYGRNLISSVIKSIGLETTDKDNHIDKLHRILIVKWACIFGDEDCIALMHNKLEAWLKDGKKAISPMDLEYTVLCYGLQNASISMWEEVLNKSKSDAYQNMYWYLTNGLSCSNQKAILERYVRDLVTNKTDQFIRSINDFLLNSAIGLNIMLDVALPMILKLPGDPENNNDFSYCIKEIGRSIRTKEQLAKLKAMENLNSLIPNDVIPEAVSYGEKNIQWLQKHNEILLSELKIKSDENNI